MDLTHWVSSLNAGLISLSVGFCPTIMESLQNLRTGFMNSIVITINRIPIVMDGTMVLAISDGELVEYDEPIVFNMYGGSVNEKWRENGRGKETLI
ncbi:hypothetical protein T459_09530 [Capsicum annuum]|uniref:Uncharacterized protein n=1 Tax=Capsicum annuum TaxID=4072 RepID=A0A2G2ZZM0_CAPAN|nr:hypothetical protein FXO37_29651 [Capsicum annuum]PHT87424.1 hypothetical protein T459_09530 [Capsicum annuum]